MNVYFDLFYSFFLIGGLTFGGGYAMLPMIQKEIVEKHKWSTNEEIIDYFAIGQCTPGIIAVNTATFVGFEVKGVLGGIIATIGVVTPSFIIIVLIASFLQQISGMDMVTHAFNGISVAVCVLIISAVEKMWKTSITDKIGVVIFLATIILSIFFNISSITLIIISIIIGIGIKWGKKEI